MTILEVKKSEKEKCIECIKALSKIEGYTMSHEGNEKWLFFIEEENEYKIIETSNIESYRVYSSYKIIKLLETYDVEL